VDIKTGQEAEMGELVDGTLDSAESYRSLRGAILSVIEAGGIRAKAAVAYETAVINWEIGGLLQDYVQGLDNVYGAEVYRQLSVDLNLRERLLYEMVEVRRAFPILRPSAKLTWGHYRRLASPALEEDRMLYLEQAVQGGWSVRELETRIRSGVLRLAGPLRPVRR
jgi:hypothetical protein